MEEAYTVSESIEPDERVERKTTVECDRWHGTQAHNRKCVE